MFGISCRVFYFWSLLLLLILFKNWINLLRRVGKIVGLEKILCGWRLVCVLINWRVVESFFLLVWSRRIDNIWWY